MRGGVEKDMDLHIIPLDLSHDIISPLVRAMRYDLGVSAAVTVSRTSSSRSRIGAGWVGGGEGGRETTYHQFFLNQFLQTVGG